MPINSNQFLEDLKNKVKEHILFTEQLKIIPNEKLNYKENSTTWSVLECIEHLNLYGDFYLPEIEQRINQNKRNNVTNFKSGVLGTYFINLMKQNSKNKPMKTAKNMNPNGSDLDKNTIVQFINHQQKLTKLLSKAKDIDLTRTKTSISISKIINLRIGDTFSFVVAHNIRHFEQIKRILRNF